MIFPSEFNRYFPVFYNGTTTTGVPPFGCMYLAEYPNFSGGIHGVGVVLGTVDIQGQTTSNPSEIVFNGPHRLKAGVASGYGGVATNDDVFIAACDKEVTEGSIAGPPTSGHQLILQPTWSQPYLCHTRLRSGTGTTYDIGIFSKLREPDGIWASAGASAIGVGAGSNFSVSFGTPTTKRTVGAGVNGVTLNAAGTWDVHFSATVQGVLGTRGDTLIVAVASTGGTIQASTGMRTLDSQNDGYDTALNTKENVAFTAAISCPYGTSVSFSNASAGSINLERICVTIRQRTVYRSW